ncbi:dihydroorotate dehydrogenase, partial [Tulasnella sp. UAMH 9824]
SFHGTTISQRKTYDGLFISNGLGDPTTLETTTTRLRSVLSLPNDKLKPAFGICLGHQLLALAAGASTRKMKYGNRGHNIPYQDAFSGRCYITSQNHGFEIELFKNANDGSNEGIISTERPFFSVQFHPDSTPGPRDTEFLFDVFIDGIQKSAETGGVEPVKPSGGTKAENEARVPRANVQKVLILGSGGLSIGQAGEFDYSGSQAIKALKEEGIYAIMVNPNIATIATSKGLADKVYFLPVNPDFVRKIIEFERPDGIYVTFGGQTASNVGVKLKDEFAALGCKVLGTPIETIITTEDRALSAQAMEEIGEKCAESATAPVRTKLLRRPGRLGVPLSFVPPQGALRKGVCDESAGTRGEEFEGLEKIEYEVVRDCRDNCITVCNMETFDPLGIHTGDSIVLAPSQTLSDVDFNMLRTTAINVIRHLGVVGECNIQYALNPLFSETTTRRAY